MTILAAWSAWWLWRGRRSGAVVNLALLPIEAIFWLGFAVPIPWLFGIARAVLLAASWASSVSGAAAGHGADGHRSPGVDLR